MMQGGSICQRADSRVINEALAHGEPARALARRYGLPKSTLARHVAHVRAIPTKGEALSQAVVQRVQGQG